MPRSTTAGGILTPAKVPHRRRCPGTSVASGNLSMDLHSLPSVRTIRTRPCASRGAQSSTPIPASEDDRTCGMSVDIYGARQLSLETPASGKDPSHGGWNFRATKRIGRIHDISTRGDCAPALPRAAQCTARALLNSLHMSRCPRYPLPLITAAFHCCCHSQDCFAPPPWSTLRSATHMSPAHLSGTVRTPWPHSPRLQSTKCGRSRRCPSWLATPSSQMEAHVHGSPCSERFLHFSAHSASSTRLARFKRGMPSISCTVSLPRPFPGSAHCSYGSSSSR